MKFSDLKTEQLSWPAVKAINGASYRRIALKYGIPTRTMEDWVAGRRSPPPYIIKLIAFCEAVEKDEK